MTSSIAPPRTQTRATSRRSSEGTSLNHYQAPSAPIQIIVSPFGSNDVISFEDFSVPLTLAASVNPSDQGLELSCRFLSKYLHDIENGNWRNLLGTVQSVCHTYDVYWADSQFAPLLQHMSESNEDDDSQDGDQFIPSNPSDSGALEDEDVNHLSPGNWSILLGKQNQHYIEILSQLQPSSFSILLIKALVTGVAGMRLMEKHRHDSKLPHRSKTRRFSSLHVLFRAFLKFVYADCKDHIERIERRVLYTLLCFTRDEWIVNIMFLGAGLSFRTDYAFFDDCKMNSSYKLDRLMKCVTMGRKSNQIQKATRESMAEALELCGDIDISDHSIVARLSGSRLNDPQNSSTQSTVRRSQSANVTHAQCDGPEVSSALSPSHRKHSRPNEQTSVSRKQGKIRRKASPQKHSTEIEDSEEGTESDNPVDAASGQESRLEEPLQEEAKNHLKDSTGSHSEAVLVDDEERDHSDLIQSKDHPSLVIGLLMAALFNEWNHIVANLSVSSSPPPLSIALAACHFPAEVHLARALNHLEVVTSICVMERLPTALQDTKCTPKTSINDDPTVNVLIVCDLGRLYGEQDTPMMEKRAENIQNILSAAKQRSDTLTVLMLSPMPINDAEEWETLSSVSLDAIEFSILLWRSQEK